uniref:ATP synthase complex subunit 8 n=1 Tax=Nerthra indica TaxID=1249914 RepID=C5HIL4_9HEMI|nr:ATP synthase F0 subunit 8 [Nerthra indica]ACJ69459.1 ATP synthase F0 subunit 8 [Nerthra indica]
MPQMAPLWWTTLFFMFLTCLMMMYINMYFLTSHKIKMNPHFKSEKKPINWKW